MYEIHPLLAHLPIGFFLISGILGIAGFFFERKLIGNLILYIVAGGIIFLIPTIYTGLKAEETAFIYGDIKHVLIEHERAAYVILVMFITAFLWMLFRRKKMGRSEYIIFVIFLAFSCSAVVFEALTGNLLTYKYGIHVETKPGKQLTGGEDRELKN